MLEVWGRANSINVQKVLWCCAEMGVPFERYDVGGPFGGNKDPEYLARNPNGLIPTISDDGFVLWESNAIVRYLAAKHGAGTLWPEDLTVRAEADKWMDWQLGTIWNSFRPVFLGLIRTPPEERDHATIEAGRLQTAEALSILDAHLSENEYVAGSSLTMADIPLGVTAYRWMVMDIERPPLSNLEAWYGRLQERETYTKNVMLPLS